MENVTVSLPEQTAAFLRLAVEEGRYASSSEVVVEAIQEWQTRHDEAFRSLKADIDIGLADMEAGRVHDFDVERIIARGQKLLKIDPADRDGRSRYC